ncbi:hypothetical protein [Sphaerobacter sp.]|uniref:hypothetical protein n=1 Tax=Sphaerobacter sp. TaxID=2099654 RepID=UPI001E18AA64|nr:hypothetical protein [Sphaerobacter sp.]MBX5446828.1 hypothetical protein [Sphaerobacter sp.]
MAMLLELLGLVWLAALIWASVKFVRSVQDLRGAGRTVTVLRHAYARPRVRVRGPAMHFTGVHPDTHFAGARGIRRE